MTRQPQMPWVKKYSYGLETGYELTLFLALHSKYEPYKPSESPSNRLLKDKTASNALE